ncbi:hypothetical protein ACIA59_10540 [Micromonospora haikouensis]|uniref:hypothetical protein n=1 Tax=Micromonospora haikouensis TaxID=686309 RepID=UPI00378D0759
MELFATDSATDTPTTPAPVRRTVPARRIWADVRPGQQVIYDIADSPWRGTWTVRRIEDHPTAPYALIVTLINGEGREWRKVPHRLASADVEG